MIFCLIFTAMIHILCYISSHIIIARNFKLLLEIINLWLEKSIYCSKYSIYGSKKVNISKHYLGIMARKL